MSQAITTPETKTTYADPTKTLVYGHPIGLANLFFTELWERFSYYGMRALLVLYMTAALADGGLGYSTPRAAFIYGLYTGAVYIVALPGGWIADNILGARHAVLVGGIIIALGHFSMAMPQIEFFYAGMILIVLGTGFLKPNISSMVGSLYENNPRRDAGFSIFYMGINIGAGISPLVCGYLAQSSAFKTFLSSNGYNPLGSWHWGFGAAGVGMSIGLIFYVSMFRFIKHVGNKPEKPTTSPAVLAVILLVGLGLFAAVAYSISQSSYVNTVTENLPKILNVVVLLIGPTAMGIILYYLRASGASKEDFRRVLVICVLFFFSAVFWSAFEQAGSSLNLFAEKLTRNSIFGWDFPSSYFQSVNSMFIILLAPVFTFVWTVLGKREPSSPAKFSFGLFFVGVGFLILVVASTLAVGGVKVAPFWLVAVYFFHTVGELCLSPVGLSTVTKLAPAKLVGMMMGIWFLSLSLGNYMGGVIAGYFDPSAEGALVTLFGSVAALTILPAALLFVLTPSIKKLMGGIK